MRSQRTDRAVGCRGSGTRYPRIDWQVLGARVRQAARAAAVLHLIERGGDENDKAVLETSHGESGG